MFKNILKILLVISLVIFTLSAVAARDITLTGSTTVLPIAQAAAEVYMKKNTRVKITVNGGGSSNGIKAIIDGTADIGDASRLAKDSEIQKAKDKGIDLYKNVVALDGIAVVAHKSCPVTSLTMEQTRDIFAGKITNWKEVGGPDMTIVVISRDTSSGTYGSFVEMVLDYKEKNKMRADAQMTASNQAMATTVAQTPYSIGYLGLGFVKAADVKVVKINNIEASDKTVKNGTYPISRTLNMYTDGKPKGEVKKFIDFILSKDGQKIVVEQGYIKL